MCTYVYIYRLLSYNIFVYFYQIFPICFKRLIGLIVSIMNEIQKSGISVEPKSGQCPSNLTGIPAPSTSNETAEAFNKFLISVSLPVMILIDYYER